jgi:hypothetical protein
MLPGQPVELDHNDDDPTRYIGWSHARCNHVAGGKLGAQRLRQRRERTTAMSKLTEVALGVQISEDRAHTAIVAAGYLDDGETALLDLLSYLNGPDAVAAIVEIKAERAVLAVVLDPHSPSATLVRPLGAAGIEVVVLSTIDVAAAHGAFIDALNGGRLRHGGQTELTAAVRHGVERKLSGATAWQPRGAAVDMSPLLAAEAAYHGLVSVPRPAFFGAWR